MLFIVVLIAALCTQSQARTPKHTRLKPIFDIHDASNVTLTLFPDYKDYIPYGAAPNVLSPSHLLSLNPLIDWSKQNSYGIQSAKDVYIAHMNNASIDPQRLGTVFDTQQQLLFSCLVNPAISLFWPLDHTVSHRPIKQYNKVATVQGARLFYHWLIDRFPSIFLLRDLLKKNSDIKLLIHSHKRVSYVEQYLELLEIPLNQYEISNENTIYNAQELYFATPFLMEPIPQKLLRDMKDLLVKNAYKKEGKNSYHNNVIIVIERQEPDRNIKNLDALIKSIHAQFKDKDYELLIFRADGPVSRQITLFNNARLIIGCMASGLSNVIYAKPGASVIEIHPDYYAMEGKALSTNHGREWCWWLASSVGLNYWMVPQWFNLSDRFVECPLDIITPMLTKIAAQW